MDISWINGSHFALVTLWAMHAWHLSSRITKFRESTFQWQESAKIVNEKMNAILREFNELKRSIENGTDKITKQ